MSHATKPGPSAMARTATTSVGVLSLALIGAHGVVQGAPLETRSSGTIAPAASTQRALLDNYCVTCHNERLKTAGLTLDDMDLARVGDHAEVWEKVVRKLRAGAMPPAGAPRPDKAASESLVVWLEETIDRTAAPKPHAEGPSYIA